MQEEDNFDETHILESEPLGQGDPSDDEFKPSRDLISRDPYRQKKQSAKRTKKQSELYSDPEFDDNVKIKSLREESQNFTNQQPQPAGKRPKSAGKMRGGGNDSVEEMLISDESDQDKLDSDAYSGSSDDEESIDPHTDFFELAEQISDTLENLFRDSNGNSMADIMSANCHEITQLNQGIGNVCQELSGINTTLHKMYALQKVQLKTGSSVR